MNKPAILSKDSVLSELFALRHRQLVAAVVLFVLGVALDPVEVNVMALQLRQQPLLLRQPLPLL